jgi:predicted nucleic acid-binding protein
MAGSSRYTVILDACVLYPALLRDVLISLGHAGLFHARWSSHILCELAKNLQADKKISADKLDSLFALMHTAIPDSLVTGYDGIINSIELAAQSDRHVIAAAVVGHADAIVTFNLRDFPPEAAEQYGIEVQHPDDFVLNQIALNEIATINAMKQIRSRLKNPPYTAEQLIQRLEANQLLLTAAHLRDTGAIDLI